MAKSSKLARNLRRKIAQSNLRLFSKIEADNKQNKLDREADIEEIRLRREKTRTAMQQVLKKGAIYEKQILEIEILLLHPNRLQGYSAIKIYGSEVEPVQLSPKLLDLKDLLELYRLALYEELKKLDQQMQELLKETYGGDEDE